jgi:cell division protein FtsL
VIKNKAMSKFLILTKIRHEFRKKSLFSHFKVNVKILNILIIFALLFAGGLYLFQISSLATKGFKIKDLEKKIETLKEQKEKIELEIADLQSTNKVQERIKNLNMVLTTKVSYISGTSSVAVK